MKVIHLIGGGDVGGAKTHILSLLAGLDKKLDVLLVSFREGPFADEAREAGIPVLVLPSRNILKNTRILSDLIKKEGYDIVHCHGAKANLVGALLKAFRKLPVVTTVHSDYRLDYLGRPLSHLTIGTINRLALRTFHYHIGVSDPVAEMLISRGFSPYGLFAIYNGLDFDDVAPPPETKLGYLRNLGLDVNEGDVILGIAARLNPVKDIPTLLRAVAKTGMPNVKLVIAGQGPEEENLKNLARSLGISDRVLFAGWVDSMDAFYQCIDINLLTSISETFPYVVTEGARYARATISTKVGGIPLLIDSGVDGFLFEPGDVDMLARHIRTLATDEALRERFGTGLREKAKRNFSIAAMIEKQCDIYETILRREKRRKDKRFTVTICGAYGRGNTGDDAILEAIVTEMRELDADLRLVVLSRSPKATKLYYRTDSLYTFNVLAFARAFKKSLLYINGGGNLMQDSTSSRSIWFYLFTLWLAKKRGANVMMYGCGIGTVERPFNRRLVGRVLSSSVDAISLRETSSLLELDDMNITEPKVVLAADPALILPPASDDTVESTLLAAGIPLGGNYISFSLRRWQHFESKIDVFRKAAEYAYEAHGLTPVFLPIERPEDERASDMVADGLTCPHYVIRNISGAKTVIGVLSKMRAALSMRLHGLIFAAGQGIPLVGVSYDAKVSAFLEYMEQDLCTDIRSVDFDTLKDLIDRALLKDRGELKAAVSKLRAVEGKNAALAAELLGLSAPE